MNKGGNYFDPNLQKGGVTKLEYDDRQKRSKSKENRLRRNKTNNDSSLGMSYSQLDKSAGGEYRRDNSVRSGNGTGHGKGVRNGKKIGNYKENYNNLLGKKEYSFYD